MYDYQQQTAICNESLCVVVFRTVFHYIYLFLFLLPTAVHGILLLNSFSLCKRIIVVALVIVLLAPIVGIRHLNVVWLLLACNSRRLRICHAGQTCFPSALAWNDKTSTITTISIGSQQVGAVQRATLHNSCACIYAFMLVYISMYVCTSESPLTNWRHKQYIHSWSCCRI